MKTYVASFLLLVAILATALQLVIQRHESRKLFVHSQQLRGEAVELGRQWGQLLLEQGTWATHGRVEEVAREKLDMRMPERENMFRIGAY